MKIDIEALKSAEGKGLTHAFTVDGTDLDVDEEEVQFLVPVAVQLKAVYGEGKVKVTGSLCTSLTLTCGRCLKPFSYPYHEEFEDEILVEKETDLDLLTLVRDFFVTALPLKPLCDA